MALHRAAAIIGILWGAAWHAGLAGVYIVTWLSPETLDPHMVHKLLFLMMIEFLTVHSTGIFAGIAASFDTRGHRALAFSGVLVVYILLALGFSAAYGGLWPLYSFLILAMPRLPSLIGQGIHPGDMFFVMGHWAAMTALYLLSIFLTLFAAVPALGITPEVIARQGFEMTGIWPEEPYRVVAAGALYFSGMALLTLAAGIIGMKQESKSP